MPSKTNQPRIEPAVMTVGEVANYLRIHQTTLYRMLKKGEIPAFRVGSDWRFNSEVVDRWSKGEEHRNR